MKKKDTDIEVVLVIDVFKIITQNQLKEDLKEQNGNTAQRRVMSPLKGNPK